MRLISIEKDWKHGKNSKNCSTRRQVIPSVDDSTTTTVISSIIRTSLFIKASSQHMNWTKRKLQFTKLQSLQTGSADYVLPRTIIRFGERGFSATVVQPPGTLFLPTSTTLLTPVHSENDSRVYLMIVLTTDYCRRSWTSRIAAPYKFHVDWLIDWLKLQRGQPQRNALCPELAEH